MRGGFETADTEAHRLGATERIGEPQRIESIPRDALAARIATSLCWAPRARWVLLLCALCLYIPFIFMGAGTDLDSLREIKSGVTLLWQHRYVPSRPPGYFPYEALCGVLYALGGTVATNFATLAMSIVLLDSFLEVCERFELPHRYLLTAMLAIHPVYWVNSTSTIDFIWALGCFFLGFRLLLKKRYVLAAALLGLAVGIRLSSVLLAAPLLGWQIFARPRDSKVWLTAAAAAAVGALLYLPAFLEAGNSLHFLTYYIGVWNVRGYLGRFIYKNLYFWGLPAAAFILTIALTLVRGLAHSDRKYSPLIACSATIILAFEALFLKIPVQRAYLLPMLPFALILFGIALRDRAPMLITLAALIFSYNFVSLNLARPDVRDHATRAILGPFLERGYLLNDAAERLDSPRNPLPPASVTID